uniref:Secreted protein n=1 Tax=Nelumbo nucifera TaxID=4432 RepID=A0A822YPU4_NELNU|nr:TPA_asm: hypothetical protein HUJ06_005250 [Nelumbo nucifera]
MLYLFFFCVCVFLFSWGYVPAHDGLVVGGVRIQKSTSVYPYFFLLCLRHISDYRLRQLPPTVDSNDQESHFSLYPFFLLLPHLPSTGPVHHLFREHRTSNGSTIPAFSHNSGVYLISQSSLDFIFFLFHFSSSPHRSRLFVNNPRKLCSRSSSLVNSKALFSVIITG